MLGSPSRGEHTSRQLLGGYGRKRRKSIPRTGWSLTGEKRPQEAEPWVGPCANKCITLYYLTVSFYYLIKGSE